MSIRQFFSRRTVTLGTATLLTSSLLVACGSASSETTDASAIGSDLDESVSLAQDEGEVRLIASPDTGANYKGHVEEFEDESGVDILVDSPDAASADALEAVKNLRGQANQPGVLDIGDSFTTPAKSQEVVEEYRPSNWDSIPDNLKHPE